MIGNREALGEWFICLQDNMTTLLMDLAIVPALTDAVSYFLKHANPAGGKRTLEEVAHGGKYEACAP